MKLPVISDLLSLAVDYGAIIKAETNSTVVVVHCHCGEVWSYISPNVYTGKKLTPECPACLRNTIPVR